jgi:hypothetical protein
MQVVPFQHMSQSSFWKFSLYYAGTDINRNFVFSVFGMKVRRAVIIPIHRDYNSEKSAYNRHGFNALKEL